MDYWEMRIEQSQSKLKEEMCKFQASMQTWVIVLKAQDKYFAEKYKRQDEFHEEFMG